MLGHFGARPGCRVSGHLCVRQHGRASGHFVAAGWVVFQKLWQSKNQSQNTARGGPVESSKEYYGGSCGDFPQAGGDGHHKVQRKGWW